MPRVIHGLSVICKRLVHSVRWTIRKSCSNRSEGSIDLFITDILTLYTLYLTVKKCKQILKKTTAKYLVRE